MTNPYQAPSAQIEGGMIHCKGCSKEVHSQASVCPHCGLAQRSRAYKSKVLAGALAMLLGAFGVHRFYLGQWWGVFYLLLFWTGIPSIVSFFEAIVMWCSNLQSWDIKYNEGKPAGPNEKAGAGTIIIVVIVVGMAVIAFIGILAAISIPAYQDYTLRARVNEALVQSIGVREEIVSYYQENDVLPQTNEDIGIADPLVLPSGHEVRLTENGFTIDLKGQENGLAGKSIDFFPFQGEGQIEWDCTGGSLPNRLRPSACRAE